MGDSMTRERAASVIAELAELIGLPGLALDEQGYCCLTFDQSIVVNVEHDPDSGDLLLYSWLGRPGRDREAVLADLLEANFFWQGTGGGTLSLERATGGVVLLDRVALAGLEISVFQRRLTGFVDRAEAWQRRLADGAGTSQPTALAPLPFGIGLRV